MLKAMGVSTSVKWKGYQAQHIIPAELKTHPVLKKIGMNLDDASNGIFLRIPNNDVSTKSRHRGYHSVYNEFVKSEDAYINWYIDDYKFDGRNGIWQDSKRALKIIKHFAGIITPDFSTYQDFPLAEKIHATYKMRTFGFWIGKEGVGVVNNVRWGTEETYDFCFEGIPMNSIVSIGTVGGDLED